MRLDQAKILNQPKPPGPGSVAVSADEAGRYTRFAICMQGLALPPGSNTVWQVGNDIPGNRNAACEGVLADPTREWLWFMDDDHVFRHDMLARLLDRNVPIVAPLCLRRVQPFLPVACVDREFLDITQYGEDELVRVEHTGSAGMLIRRSVIEALEPPWFELSHEANSDPDGPPLRVSEDVNFCRRAVAAGIEIYVDMHTRLGHMTTASIMPVWHEQQQRWLTGFSIADGMQLTIEPFVEA